MHIIELTEDKYADGAGPTLVPVDQVVFVRPLTEVSELVTRRAEVYVGPGIVLYVEETAQEVARKMQGR